MDIKLNCYYYSLIVLLQDKEYPRLQKPFDNRNRNYVLEDFIYKFQFSFIAPIFLKQQMLNPIIVTTFKYFKYYKGKSSIQILFSFINNKIFNIFSKSIYLLFDHFR